MAVFVLNFFASEAPLLINGSFGALSVRCIVDR